MNAKTCSPLSCFTDFVSCELQTDPFNRSHLTSDMLIPNTELKARIEEFIRSQELKKHAEGFAMQQSKAAMQTTPGEMTLID